MDTQSPTYSDDELTAALAEHLASLDRDDSYRVERVLKRSSVETTELVYFEGTGGGSLGPFVRKRIDASAQIGGAYERLFAAQRAGRRFEHLPRIVDCRRVGDELNVVMEYIEGEIACRDRSGRPIAHVFIHPYMNAVVVHAVGNGGSALAKDPS